MWYKNKSKFYWTGTEPVIEYKDKFLSPDGKEISPSEIVPLTDEILDKILSQNDKTLGLVILSKRCKKCRQILKEFIFMNWKDLIKSITPP